MMSADSTPTDKEQEIKKDYLTSCPSEILSLIAEQAHLQDENFRVSSEAKTLECTTNQEGVDSTAREDPYHFIKQKEWKWYGKSTMALGSTCTIFRKLCLPFLFKILPLSKTKTGLFHLHIKKQHGHSFETIFFDLQDGEQDVYHHHRTGAGSQATKDLLLHTLADLPNVTSFIFSSNGCCQIWQQMAAALGVDLATQPATDAIMRNAASTISPKITKLQVRDCTVTANVFSNLRNLETFELVRTQDLGDFGSFGYGVASSEKLKSISFYLDPWHATIHIPETWSSYDWNTQEALTDLKLEMGSLDGNDWAFVTAFASSLETLDLKISLWEVSTTPTSTRVDFPNLEAFTLWVKLDGMPKLLKRLSTPSLTNLSLHGRFSDDQLDESLFEALQPFKSKLKTFELSLNGKEMSADQIPNYNSFIADLPHGSKVNLRIENYSLWYRVSQSTFIPDEKVAMEIMKETASLLKYARERLEAAKKMGDGAGVAEWMRWMAPLAARRTLEDQ